ncbi:hypothetical protein PENNAL_c0008G02558 [Penicillium nalgiovense]|uniref:Uncharacterized protein n=1 Tax=Penicillium nalgiovense TaxID=60175 RepID=A0A1V6YWK3_PENNA|nr:hypothetical protein PENNAL_c0008G02558 [Penicillium nalgiovense]
MGLKSLMSRLKRRAPAEDPISHSGPISGSNGKAILPPPAPKDTEINLLPQKPASDGRDLWLEAFEKLPRKSQQELEKRGMNRQGSESMVDQVKEFQKEAETQRGRSLAKDWRVQIGDHEIPVRQTTLQIVHWAEKIGDVAIQFAPAPGSGGVWAVARSVLEGIDTFDKEKSALLSVVDKVAGAIFCSQVYYEIYNLERTGRKDVVDRLHDAIVALYGCVLELLVTSSDLSSNTAVQFCQSVFDTTKPSGMLLELERLEQELATAAGKCEDTAHAHQEVIFKDYLQEAQNSLNGITRHMEHVFQWVNDQERRDLLDWVSDIQSGRHHDEIEERREPGTGGWLVQDERFHEWMDSPSSSTLWLQGSPGTGKSFLASAVVKHTEDTKGSQMEGFGYFFCNQDEKNRREALPVLRSFTSASKLKCCHQLVEAFNLYSTSVIILDALDEVLDDELDILVEALEDAIAESKDRGRVKLFVASRPEKNIGAKYGSSSTVIIQAQDNKKDIEKFVTKEMDKFEKRHPNSELAAMKDTVVRVILEKCDNMFLWAALQGLDGMYDQIYRKIQSRFPPEQAIAERTFKWVLCTPYPLTSEEILSAARMAIEKDDIKLTSYVQQESLLSICENLLIVDTDGRWRFFHLSAREHLGTTLGIYQQAHSYCAQVCHLSLMRTFGPETLPGSSQDPFNEAHTFSHHTQTCWAFYALEQPQPEEDQYVISLKKFLGSPNKSSSFYIRWLDHIKANSLSVELPFREGLPLLYYEDLAPATTPMFTIAQISLYETTLRKWCDNNDFDPFQQNDRGEGLLTIAAMTNCIPLCATLIAKGVPVNQSSANGRYGSALAAAAKWGRLDTVKYLVQEAKADVNLPLQSGDYGGALYAAVSNGSLDIVRYFAEEVPDVNLLVHGRDHGNVLAAAAFSGKLDIVRYLVEEANFDVNLEFADGKFISVLGRAAWGTLDVVKYLVEEAKAVVNVPNPARNALVAAVLSEHLDMVRYFVEEAKADVDLLRDDKFLSRALEDYRKEDAVAVRHILKLPSDQGTGDEH